jgi:hypothetical protein
MTSKTTRAVGALGLTLAAAMLATPPPAVAAPQSSCAGAFCSALDLGTFDALAPTQATTAAAQPTNLALRFTDTSGAVASDPSTWLARVSAVLGSSSSKAMGVSAPSTLPLGSYVAGSAATASACGSASDYAAACPAGFGSGQVVVTPLVGSPEIKPATFGIRRITSDVGGSLAVEVTVAIPGVTLVPVSTTTVLTYAPASATAGPSLAMDTRPALTGALLAPQYVGAGLDFSMNTLALNLNGLVTEAATGAVSPPVAFVRQSPLCTTLTSTLAAQARSTAVAAAQFPQTITGCPTPPVLVSVAPVAGQATAFSFTTKTPTAAVAGRTSSLEWVFGDGSKAVTGATTTHAYPVSQPVTAVVTTVDSAGARSTGVQVKIGASALRGKQREGHLVTGELTDQDTGEGLASQEVHGYRCATRNTPVAGCEDVGTATTKSGGTYRLRIPEVRRKGFVLVSTSGTATTSATEPARFGSRRYIAVLPQPNVTLKVSKKQIRQGGTVRLSGTVEPGKKGKTVRLQGFIRGKWRTVRKATISQRGTYAASYVVRVPGQDKLKVRALVVGTARTLEATSKVRRIRILR